MPIYKAYGLSISSDIALPALELVEITEQLTDADIAIQAGPVSADSGGDTKFRNWEAGPDRFLSHFFNVGRFLVTDGNSIRYQREDGTDDTQIVSILLGTCLGAALMQRKILPIHACSVLTDKGALLVMGRSGAGKSTTLGGLLDLGLPMLADDVTGLRLGEDRTPLAIPAFPSIRLWRDSLRTLGHTPQGLTRVRNDMDKYYLPVSNFHNTPAPLRAIVHITASNGASLRIEEVEPAHQIETMSRFIFRKKFIDGMGLRRFAFETIAASVQNLPILRVIRPVGAIAPRQVAETILDNLNSLETRGRLETIAE